MKVIGVTGGVGAGKSEVLGYIAEHWNATVVEADEVGYLVMRPGKACYSSIVDLFGTEIVKEDQTLDLSLIHISEPTRHAQTDAGPGTDCKNCI